MEQIPEKSRLIGNRLPFGQKGRGAELKKDVADNKEEIYHKKLA
jgi:hypothetical protein